VHTRPPEVSLSDADAAEAAPQRWRVMVVRAEPGAEDALRKAIPGAQGGTNRNNTLAQGGTVGVAKLRGPGAVRQEPGAGALINELIKDALKELGRAEASLIK
jgi:hypothetical protein